VNMAIATLTKKEQEAISDHGHLKFLEIGHYQTFRRDDKRIDGNSSLVVECTKCNEVLVELIGGREQKEVPTIEVYCCHSCKCKLDGIVYALNGLFHCECCFRNI
jgi:hypothetical protein